LPDSLHSDMRTVFPLALVCRGSPLPTRPSRRRGDHPLEARQGEGDSWSEVQTACVGDDHAELRRRGDHVGTWPPIVWFLSCG